ncbi:hypothetical protein X801_01505 [Opisthorchis viverrini]|nr:hypothetical protein X801_01505 [Opisthorchis viverrini]
MEPRDDVLGDCALRFLAASGLEYDDDESWWAFAPLDKVVCSEERTLEGEMDVLPVSPVAQHLRAAASEGQWKKHLQKMKSSPWMLKMQPIYGIWLPEFRVPPTSNRTSVPVERIHRPLGNDGFGA